MGVRGTSGFSAEVAGFRVWGLRVRSQGIECRVEGSRFRVEHSPRDLTPTPQGSGFRV